MLDDKTNTDTPHYVALLGRLAFVWLPDLPFVDQATFDNHRDSIIDLYNDRELFISYDQPV